MILANDAQGGGGGPKAAALAQNNAVKTAALPLAEGGGSRGGLGRVGRESS
jgi:hypothetical protein